MTYEDGKCRFPSAKIGKIHHIGNNMRKKNAKGLQKRLHYKNGLAPKEASPIALIILIKMIAHVIQPLPVS
ncbi:MAG: hypothetical protein J5548_08165 [Prevotella sp.]|nr:hypothetical protein [Prevotella sp.]